VLEALADAGAQRFLEVGPGNVLTGLVRRTLPGLEAVSLEEMARA
jgi:[acyl-carrier-protein] S-malonyltransferase